MKTKEIKKVLITFEEEDIEALYTAIDLLNDVLSEVKDYDSSKIRFDSEMYLEVEDLSELIDNLNNLSDYGKNGLELE